MLYFYGIIISMDNVEGGYFTAERMQAFRWIRGAEVTIFGELTPEDYKRGLASLGLYSLPIPESNTPVKEIDSADIELFDTLATSDDPQVHTNLATLQDERIAAIAETGNDIIAEQIAALRILADVSDTPG